MTTPKDGRVETLWGAWCEEHSGSAITSVMPFNWVALRERFGKLPAERISVEDCRAHTKERRDKGIRDGTIYTELGRLRMVLRWAQKRRLIEHVPHIERPPASKPKELYLTRGQAGLLIGACETPHIKLFVVLALSTGARNEALLGLTWDRVDFARGRVDFNEPGTAHRQKGRAVVPMTNTLREALQSAHEYSVSKHVIEWGGEPVKSVKKALSRAAIKAGVGHVSPHMLRHSAAVHMAEARIPMEEIAQYLGHASPAITRRVYARHSPDFLREAANALEYKK